MDAGVRCRHGRDAARKHLSVLLTGAHHFGRGIGSVLGRNDCHRYGGVDVTEFGIFKFSEPSPSPAASRALPKFESYGTLESTAVCGSKPKAPIERFHGIGRLDAQA